MALNNYQDADFSPSIEPSNVRPSMGTYNTPQSFRFWCQKVLPLVYDDSLSYYELLCKVVDYLNKTMEDVNTAVEDVTNLNSAFGNLENHVNASETALLQAYNDLQDYVNTYFNNLDVQEEINNKLDVMAEDGTLDTLLLPYFNAYTESTNEIIDERFNAQNETLHQQTNNINLLRTEFDAILNAQTSGDLPDMAEVVDARVGADGNTYNTLGNAIRTQINPLYNFLNPQDEYNSSTDITETDYYLNSTGEFVHNDFWCVTKRFVLDPDRVYEYSGLTNVGGEAPVSVFYSADNTFVDYFKQQPGKQTLNIPTGASKVKFSIRKDESANFKFQSYPSDTLGDVVDDIDDINTKIDSMSGYVFDPITTTLVAGVLNNAGGSGGNVGNHATISVTEGERYLIFAHSWESIYIPFYLFMYDGTVVSYQNVEGGQIREVEVSIPKGVNQLVINTHSYLAVSKGTAVKSMPYSKWHGKKIAWFGTSIPATSSYNAVLGYPEYVGRLLGATVYNEAVGSSTARRGFKTAQSENDPYGWTGMGEAALWNLGSTIAEKNEIINNWESKWRALTGYNVELTESLQNKAINCSYENKLMQYITTTPVDLYVFDHGYNDWSANSANMEMNTSDPFDRSTFQGAMNVFIDAIMKANPRARIVIISHYESQERPTLTPMQKEEAEYWNLPFCKLYENLGWANNRTVSTTGYWSNGTGRGMWIPSGGEEQTINLKRLHMPDGRHPNLDDSGHACMDIGSIIADFINALSPAE